MVKTCKFKKIHISIFAKECSIHTRRWVLGLRDLGHHVDLITLFKDPIHDIGGIDLGAKSKVGYLMKISKLKKIVKNLHSDIFHSHYASSCGFLASFVNHPRKILSVWGSDILTFPKNNLLKKRMLLKSLSGAQRITATSEYLKQATLKLQNALPQIKVIPFGINLNTFFYVKRVPTTEIKIGISKKLEAIYGVDTLIKAFHILSSENDKIKLIIAGEGSMENNYKRMANRLGLGGKINFVGNVEHSLMPEFLASLDIATMPSDCEGFGVAALEASATGLPIVATRVGGVPEVVIDGVTGFLAEEKDAVQIAQYLNRLIKDSDLRHRMGLAGRKMVENRYRWEDNLSMMEQLYYEMLKS